MEKKEITHIIIALILMTLILTLFTPNLLTKTGLIFIATILLFSILILLSNFLGKFLAGKYTGIKISHEIWKFQRYWFTKKRHLKKPFPIGLILSPILFLLSNGRIKALTFLQTNLKPKTERILKKRGKKSFYELEEFDIALIIFWGLTGVLILSLLANLLNFPSLAKLSIYYVIWNIIPISKLDGTQLFLGSRALYITQLILLLITGLIVFF